MWSEEAGTLVILDHGGMLAFMSVSAGPRGYGLFPAVELKCRARTKGRNTGVVAQHCKKPGETFHNASFL